MRAFFPSIFFVLLGVGCGTKPAPADETAKPESRATAMPENLRCERAADCTPEATCYWSTPSWVAAATAKTPKCDDADPVDASRPKFTCGCQEGQCVPVTE